MRIAITGGIGSGKSTVCKHLENRFKVFYSDVIAKNLANTNTVLKNKIIEEFGCNSYVDGIYNTNYIRNIVFNDKNELNKLNKCFSDMVLKEYLKESEKYETTFFESALIFEHNIENNFDLIIGVYCSEAETIKRIKNRNGFDENEIKKIMNNQINSIDKILKSDIIINTSNGIDYNKLNLITNLF